MCILLGLVRLDLGVGGGLDDAGEVVVGVVYMQQRHAPIACTAQLARHHIPFLTPPNILVLGLHETAAEISLIEMYFLLTDSVMFKKVKKNIFVTKDISKKNESSLIEVVVVPGTPIFI